MASYALYWQQATSTLGWTFVHFLWQGALIGVFYTMLRSLFARPTRRYLAGVLALLALAIAPALTAWQIWQQQALSMTSAIPVSMHASAIAASVPGVLLASESQQPLAQVSTVSRLLPWLGALWMAGVLLLSLNSLRHWRQVRRLLHRDAQPVDVWQYRLLRLCDRFAISARVQLMQSASVLTPTLVGWLKPIIILPASVLAGFTPQQIEMIIAHELAHVRRCDYLVNLFQVALETVLFYHPVVHWISRDVRNLRETCCDDLVLELGGGSALAYAHALADLEGLRSNIPAPALAASGGLLLARVRRIVGVETVAEPAMPVRQQGWIVLLLLALLVLACLHSPDSSSRPVAVAAEPIAAARSARQAIAALQRLVESTAPSGAVATATNSPAAALDPPTVAAAQSAVPVPGTPSLVAAERMLSLSRVDRPVVAPTAVQVDAGLRIRDLAEPMSLARVGLTEPARARMPALLRRVAPAYPTRALAQDQQGQVSLSFSVATDGSVQAIERVSATGSEALVAAATEALQQWRFDPATVTDETSRYTQDFDFAVHPSAQVARNEEPGCTIGTGSHICRRSLREPILPVTEIAPMAR